MNWSTQKCTVTGTLAYVFWISRLFGVAPLAVENTNSGMCIQPSTACDLYGKVLAVVLTTLDTLALYLDMFMYPESTIRMNTNANRLVWIIDVQVANIVVLLSTFTGMARMKSLIGYLMDLEKIKAELTTFSQYKPQSEKKMASLMICSMVAALILLSYDFAPFIKEVIDRNGHVFASSLYVFYNITCVVLQITIIQYSVITTVVLWTSKILNESLKNLLHDIITTNPHQSILTSTRINNYQNRLPLKSVNIIIDSMVHKESVISNHSKTVSSQLRQLGFVYCSLCEVIRRVDESHSVVLVTLFIALIVNLIVTPYHFIIYIFDFEKSDHGDSYSQIFWLLFHLSNMTLLIEPCHRTHVQLELTKTLISQMSRFIPAENDTLEAELELFYKHLKLNKARYSPMNMFTLNRSLIVTILGSITTYVVVILHL